MCSAGQGWAVMATKRREEIRGSRWPKRHFGHSSKAFLSRWPAVTRKERDVVREMKGEGT